MSPIFLTILQIFPHLLRCLPLYFTQTLWRFGEVIRNEVAGWILPPFYFKMFSEDWQWWFTEDIWRWSTQKMVTCLVPSFSRRLLPIWLTLELYTLAHIRKPPLTEDHTHNWSCDTEKNTHQEAASHRRPHTNWICDTEKNTSGSRLSRKTTRTTGAVTPTRIRMSGFETMFIHPSICLSIARHHVTTCLTSQRE
jgi:hypothetical protein